MTVVKLRTQNQLSLWRFTIRFLLHVLVEPVDVEEASAAAAATVGADPAAVERAVEFCVACEGDEDPLLALLPEATRLEICGPGKDV